MRTFALLIQITFLSLASMGAKTHFSPKHFTAPNDIKFLELKYKKEINDKKISPSRKYLLAVLAARELKLMNHPERALAFYKMAKDLKVDVNKNEIQLALEKKASKKLFFYDVNLKSLLKKKQYEKALLAINPEVLNNPEFLKYKITYDLLNVKIKKHSVKKLFCLDDLQKNPDDYQYSNLLCDMLVDYQKEGKINSNHFKLIEEYFLKHDMKEIYLLSVAKDLN